MEAMTQYKDNVIIPNSSGIKLLNQLFPKLKEFTKKNPEYRIKLVGYPEWQTYASNHLENFYQFNTYAYSSFFRNPLNGNADEFENAYQGLSHTDPRVVATFRYAGFRHGYLFPERHIYVWRSFRPASFANRHDFLSTPLRLPTHQ